MISYLKIEFRMINNSSQISCIPSESIINNNSNEIDLNPLLSTELIITSQPVFQVNPLYMITNPIPTMNQRQQPQQPNTFTRRRAQQQRQQQQTTALTQRQLDRQRRRRRQRQRRRQRRAEQRRQQQGERPRNHEPVVQWTWQPTIQIFNYEWTEEDYEHFNYPDYMDRSFNDSVYESYELERLEPRERWEQEQLNELEGFAVLEQLLLMEHDIEEQNRMSLTSTIIIEEEEQGQIIDEQ